MTQIFLIILLILLNGIFAASEVSLISLNQTKLENDVNEGKKRAKKILKFVEKPTTFLSTIQIGITLFGFINGYIAGDAYSSSLATFLNDITGISVTILLPIATFLITLVLAYFQVVLGELVPKRLGMKYPEKTAYLMVPMLGLLASIMRPFVWLLTSSANLIGHLFGIDPNESDDQMSEEDIRFLVSASGRKGVIEKDETEMIHNIFEFNDTTVDEIMTHRTELSSIQSNIKFDDLINFIASEPFTRFPVYKDTIDEIIGTIHVKDVLKYLKTKSTNFNLNKILRKPYFVPDSKRTSDLLKEMKSTKNHIAIVIDEYGGTAGIVTMEDLIEEIVGNIFDEYDDVENEIEEVSSDEFIIEGLTNIDDVEEKIHGRLPVDEYETLSGFILGQIGRFPEENELIEFEFENYRYLVLEIDDKVITKVKVTKLTEEELNQAEEEISE